MSSLMGACFDLLGIGMSPGAVLGHTGSSDTSHIPHVSKL